MKRFVVAHMTLFDNHLTQEIIEAETEQEARWMHSKLQDFTADWARCHADTKDMDGDEFQEWCFSCDFLVSVVEV